MSFPLKFKPLLEKTEEDVEQFNEAWITWAVCGCEEDSCGWEGWILEAVLKREKGGKLVLPSDSDQVCPHCDKQVFRTGVSVKVCPSEDQTPDLVAGVDYEEGPMEYE